MSSIKYKRLRLFKSLFQYKINVIRVRYNTIRYLFIFSRLCIDVLMEMYYNKNKIWKLSWFLINIYWRHKK